jgi:hypothetical protein
MTHNELFPKVTVGLDLGDRTSQLYAIDAAGQCVEERTVSTTAARANIAVRDRGPPRWALQKQPFS